MKPRRYACLLAVLLLLPISALWAQEDVEQRAAFREVLARRADAAVSVKFVMSVSMGGADNRQEGQTQGTLVSADGLVLVPARVVSLDLAALVGGGRDGGAPTAQSREFTVRLPGSDEWLAADLITRDSELGVAWLRLRRQPKALAYVDLGKGARAEPGSTFYTVLRTSEQFGGVPLVRAGLVMGETRVPQPVLLVDGVPGLAYDAAARPLGFVDLDLATFARAGGVGLDVGDMAMMMVPVARLAEATRQAAALPPATLGN